MTTVSYGYSIPLATQLLNIFRFSVLLDKIKVSSGCYTTGHMEGKHLWVVYISLIQPTHTRATTHICMRMRTRNNHIMFSLSVGVELCLFL